MSHDVPRDAHIGCMFAHEHRWPECYDDAPRTEAHPDDDFVARAQRYRDEHEATHEDEMCGGPCIVLGLTDAPRTEAPDLPSRTDAAMRRNIEAGPDGHAADAPRTEAPDLRAAAEDVLDEHDTPGTYDAEVVWGVLRAALDVSALDCVTDGTHSDDLTHAESVRNGTHRAALSSATPAPLDVPATFPLDVDAFLAGLDSPNHSPESRRAWVALFYRDMQRAGRIVEGGS
jgi:hypothetical protein